MCGHYLCPRFSYVTFRSCVGVHQLKVRHVHFKMGPKVLNQSVRAAMQNLKSFDRLEIWTNESNGLAVKNVPWNKSVPKLEFWMKFSIFGNISINAELIDTKTRLWTPHHCYGQPVEKTSEIGSVFIENIGANDFLGEIQHFWQYIDKLWTNKYQNAPMPTTSRLRTACWKNQRNRFSSY